MGMKVYGLKVENVKNVAVVECKFNGRSFVEVTGKNGSGKTAILDALFGAIVGNKYYGGGKEAWRVIRKGENKARIVVSLSDGERTIDIHRSITRREQENGEVVSGGTLTIVDSKGESLGQGFLDGLLNRFTVDPLGFAALPTKEQARIMKEIAGVDVDAYDEKEAELFQARRDAKRDRDALAARVPEPVLSFDRVNIEAIKEESAEAREQANAAGMVQHLIQRMRTLLAETAAEVAEPRRRITEAFYRFEEAQAGLNDSDEAYTAVHANVVAAGEIFDRYEAALQTLSEQSQWPDIAPVDLADADEKLAEAYETNKRADAYDAYKAAVDALEAKEAEVEQLEADLKQVRKDRADAIANSKLPFKNVTFNEQDGLLINDLRFSDHSHAEQIRLSTRIGMELAPGLRIIRIPDGATLDEDANNAIQTLAKEHDYQILVESVGEKSGDSQIIMRAGTMEEAFGKERGGDAAKID